MDIHEAKLKTARQASPDEVANLRRDLSEIESSADSMGVEFIARVVKARAEINRTYVEVLHEDAKKFAAENSDQRKLALLRYTKAEDEIIKLLDDAEKNKKKDKETAVFYEGHYQEVITESDDLVTKTYTAKEIEKIPWKDLLSGEQATFWNPAAAKGFSHAIANGQMTLIGPDVGANAMGLISIGDREIWRDFIMDMEFTMDSGDFKMYLRLGLNPNNTVTQVKFKSGADGIVAGKKYQVTLKVIGSTVELVYYPEDVPSEPTTVDWTKSRKGAVGFALSEGTRLKFTRLKVRELRSSSNK